MRKAANGRAAEAADPTRRKLLEAAGETFAKYGYQGATVRAICARAGANVAAVNYYFGGKTGLYVEVMRESIGSAREEAGEAAGKNRKPEEVLRALIHGMFQRMIASERPSWHFRLMAHEMARPTPALKQVIDEAIRPNYEFLRKTLSAILKLPPEHATTRMCAHSVIGQVIHYVHARPVIGELWPELRMMPAQAGRLAEHVADFSLYSVKEIARRKR